MAALLAGLLAANGYEADVVTTGRQAFRMATTSPDYDFMLLHYSLRYPHTRRSAHLAAARPDHAADADRRPGLTPTCSRPSESRPASRPRWPDRADLARRRRIRIDELMRLVGRDNVPLAGDSSRRPGRGLIGQLAENPRKVHDLRPLAPTLAGLLTIPGVQDAAVDAIVSVGGAANASGPCWTSPIATSTRRRPGSGRLRVRAVRRALRHPAHQRIWPGNTTCTTPAPVGRHRSAKAVGVGA